MLAPLRHIFDHIVSLAQLLRLSFRSPQAPEVSSPSRRACPSPVPLPWKPGWWLSAPSCVWAQGAAAQVQHHRQLPASAPAALRILSVLNYFDKTSGPHKGPFLPTVCLPLCDTVSDKAQGGGVRLALRLESSPGRKRGAFSCTDPAS